MKRHTGKNNVLLRNLWMSLAVGVMAGLATLPTASAAPGNFSKGFGAAVGHGFRSSFSSGYHGYGRGHGPRTICRPRYYQPYGIYSYAPYSFYRDPNQSGFYWPRQNNYPASVPATPGIYVVPSPPRSSSWSGYPVRRTITINPSPYQEAGSAILNQREDRQQEGAEGHDDRDLEHENGSTNLNLDYPAYSQPLPDIQIAQAWHHLEQGQARPALGIFSTWSLAQPDNMEPKLGYGLAAAMHGDNLTAAYALRVVFANENGPAIELGNLVTPKILEQLAAHRLAPAERASSNPDELWVAAVICYLKQTPAEGLKLVERGQALDTPSPSWQNLKRLLVSQGKDVVSPAALVSTSSGP